MDDDVKNINKVEKIYFLHGKKHSFFINLHADTSYRILRQRRIETDLSESREPTNQRRPSD